ncbi:MAG: hypothetical protein IJ588_12485 [Prevotella sp.]|nr:hypothetical protein [Prevotella sp.]
MDFNSLGENSIVHIVRKKPFEYLTGTLKSKTAKQQQSQYLLQQVQQPVDVVITVNGSDEVVPGIQQGMEAVEYRGSFYCTTADGAQQAIANMMQMASNGKAEMPYYDSILQKGEKYMEHLNPQYAEGKRQARSIKALEERQDAQDKKLDRILSRLDEFFDSPKK